MPQGALRRQDMQALVGSPTVDLRGELIYRGLSSDRAGRLRSIRTSKFSSKSIFLLCGKCAICDFPSETSATLLPPFRNALRLEKNCELMRCSLKFQTAQNETFQSVPELSGTYRSSFDVKSISCMTS